MAYRKMATAFQVGSVDQLCETVETSLTAKLLQFPLQAVGLDARAHRASLPQSDLWYCAYGIPLTLEFPDSDYIRVQIPQSGSAETSVGGRTAAVCKDKSCISPSGAAIDFGADFRQLVWRIPMDLLVRKLSVLIDRPVMPQLEFALDYDLSAPGSRTLLALLECALDCAVSMPGTGSRVQSSEIEQAMTTALLRSSRHNYSALLMSPEAGAAPWQVKRVECYIEAHWDEPVQIEKLVEVTGASARSIFRSFKQSRGYSPMEFAKRLRLQRAMEKLSEPAQIGSVTEVAFDCGFGDLSRFSKDFTACFGLKPSEVLRRAKGRGTN